MRIYLNKILIMPLLIFIAGCGSSIENLTLSKKKVAEYYESGAYEKELKNLLDDARNYINTVPVEDSSAVIIDVDETALNNYESIKSVDFGYWPPQWDAWIMESAAPAALPVLEFYRFVRSKNIRVIFLTGREEAHYNSTYDNLIKAGYTQFDTLIVRNRNSKNLTAVDFKSTVRRQLTSAGYSIIAAVGDQHSDLEGDNAGFRVKLPNYLYQVD